MKSEPKYLLVENNRETGPFTASQIHARIAAGEIFSETLCIPKSLFSVPAALETFFPNTARKPIDSSMPSEIDEVTLETANRAREYTLQTTAKARLTRRDKATYVVPIVLGVLATIPFWPLGLALMGVGFYFRHLAIHKHKTAVLREGATLDNSVRPEFEAIIRPVVATKRFLFWVFAGWFVLGVLAMLLLSTRPGKSVEEILQYIFFSSIIFFVPSYFACRKLEPAYTLPMLFSSRRRAEFRAREKEEQSLAMKLKIERDLKAQVVAEHRERDRALRAQENAKEKALLRAKESKERVLLAAKKIEVEENMQWFLASLRKKSRHEPVVATVQGGSGMPFRSGEVVWLGCRENSIAVSRIEAQQDFTIPYADLFNVEVGGPGTESSSAGIMGGGFGLEGAAKGVLIASAINLLTSRSTTNTFVRISTSKAEVLLHTSTLEPAQLRLILSPAFVQVEANRQVPHPRQVGIEDLLSSEIKELHRMHREGILSEEEFTLAKTKLLSKTDAY